MGRDDVFVELLGIVSVVRVKERMFDWEWLCNQQVDSAYDDEKPAVASLGIVLFEYSPCICSCILYWDSSDWEQDKNKGKIA